jgi:RNA polymerase sigma-70 factor (ECF subfamily)
MLDTTDQVLLRACRRGDEAAARALHARLTPALVAYAKSILKDIGLAEDAVQAAFCRLFRASVREVDRVDSPKAWLARIVRREALTIARGNHRLVQRHRRWADGRDAVSGTADDDRGELRELGRAVLALPRRMSEVIALKHVCALTFDEIAVALNINRNTAASRYRAAIDRLRTALTRPAPEGKEPTRHAR